MFKSICDALDQSAERFANKAAFCSDSETSSFSGFSADARRIGTWLVKHDLEKHNVAIFIDKSVNCLRAMFGSAYANACYTVLDICSPKERLISILSTLQPDCVIVDKGSAGRWPLEQVPVFHLEEMLVCEADTALLARVHASMCDTDPLYILFTSGSTGVPKGTVICHRSVLAYASTICRTFSIDEKTTWGSQTPLYFSMSVLDVFTTVLSGASFCIIPKLLFSFPGMLMEYLNEKRVNAIYWVPSALGIVANFNTFDEIRPLYLEKVLFAGEVMPVKPLKVWQRALPHALFANLYGPTEITDTCTYYIVDREFADDETLPIGVPFDNCDILVLDKDNRRVLPGSNENGELCVRGSFLGLGYYNNPEKTAAVFTQNPLNTSYPELVYRTGDLVAYNDKAELVYCGRKDFQIKHMGYRIELGEIEAAISAVDGIIDCACVYADSQIVLFYQAAGLEEAELQIQIIRRLVSYMRPTKLVRLRVLPHNANGKIDRKHLTAMLSEDSPLS